MKKMKKVIIIESCEDCPHAIYDAKCGLMLVSGDSDLESSATLQLDLTILDNCPLSNVEDV